MYTQIAKLLIIYIFSFNAIHASEAHQTHEEDNSFEEHAAHEHGHATAQITFVDNILIFDLTLPSMNIFGFEHNAKNKEQEEVITQSTSILNNSDNIIIVNPVNSCELTSMEVESDLIKSISDDTHEHHDEHIAEEHHDAHSNQEHNDVSIHQEYTCSKDSIESINYKIFDAFPTIEEIEVQYISNISQKIYSVTPKQHIQPLD